MIFTSIL